MVILGLNAYHGDSAAALVVNGELVAAAEEERFRRIKHWAGFPSEAIRYCLTEAGLTLADVDGIAINQDSSANRREKALYALRNRLSPAAVFRRLANRRKRDDLPATLQQAFPGHGFTGKFHSVEHHLAHLSSAFHVSPFTEAVAVSVDGFGDFASAAWGVGNGCEITINNRVLFPHSLGIFYQALTQYLGFPHYGDEYKIMGLAPYGKPVHLDKMRQIVQLLPDGGYTLNLEYFVHHRANVTEGWDGGAPSVGTLYSDRLADLLGPLRTAGQALEQHHHDIARSVQAMYEEAFFHLLNTAYAATPMDAVVVSGGCGMNSVANGKIRLQTPFKKIYVQSAAGDAGGAIGSAMSVWHSNGGARNFHMAHSSWGPGFTDSDIHNLLTTQAAELAAAGCQMAQIHDEDTLCQHVAKDIAEGLVIGWFQGRMEWGPRALGNRSILGDPRRANMKDILNLKIKRRESFRPFAPSVLREHVADWFEQDGDVPFMMQVFRIREEQRPHIPAITHVDGTGRLQTVSADTNPRYHRLITAFHGLSGVPMVLNTSFNENEPVVCTPEQALACFLRTNMDVLVLENWVIRRNPPA
jgi:carbamoyltransferase